jgi:hypothetical protein
MFVLMYKWRKKWRFSHLREGKPLHYTINSSVLWGAFSSLCVCPEPVWVK